MTSEDDADDLVMTAVVVVGADVVVVGIEVVVVEVVVGEEVVVVVVVVIVGVAVVVGADVVVVGVAVVVGADVVVVGEEVVVVEVVVGGIATSIDNCFDNCVIASLIVTVNAKDPDALGVPVTVPVRELRLNPLGKLPEDIDHLLPSIPPIELSVAE